MIDVRHARDSTVHRNPTSRSCATARSLRRRRSAAGVYAIIRTLEIKIAWVEHAERFDPQPIRKNYWFPSA
jgi:hypothetical protein